MKHLLKSSSILLTLFVVLAILPSQASAQTVPGRGGTGNILVETWDNTTLYDNDAPRITPGATWVRSLTIHGCSTESILTGPCIGQSSTMGPLRNNTGVGIDIIPADGRKVARFWLQQNTGSSHGARLALTNNHNYAFLKPWGNRRIYGRFYMKFPKLLPVSSGGSWMSIGVEMKDQVLNQGAAIQQNYDREHKFWQGSIHGGIINTNHQFQANRWYRVDVVWDMFYDSRGKWATYIDGVKYAEHSGKMAHNPDGYGFWIFNLYGDLLQSQVRGEMYIGDVILSTAPIDNLTPTTPTPAPTVVPTATPIPTTVPTAVPTVAPTTQPTSLPTSLPGTPMANNNNVTWSSTLDSASAITSPTVGSPGNLQGVTFALAGTGRVGNAASISLNGYIGFPTTNFNKPKGIAEFWFKPNWNHTDNTNHRLFTDNGGGLSLIKNTANQLVFQMAQGTTFPEVRISPNNYSLTNGVWTHIRVEWDDQAAISNQLRIIINGTEPVHTDGTDDFNRSLLTLGNEMIIGLNSNATYDNFTVTNGQPVPSSSPTTPPGKPGDADGDGDIDGVDYVRWLNNYGRSLRGASNGDFNDDGVVDGRDYVTWANNFNS